jgi:arylsulfatase A-like enzyme
MKPRFNRRDFLRLSGAGVTGLMFAGSCASKPAAPVTGAKPNIVIIYADDLGYGEISCYGAHSLTTPNLDKLAAQGVRFTDAHCTSATCTPSRYSLLTGQYAWRRPDTFIATGDAPAIIRPGTPTVASALKQSGYTTGVVGKWHLGLGPAGGADWNGEIQSSPRDIGFDYSFLIPATGDRVPCVFVENRHVVDLDPADPIEVSFKEPLLDLPTGKDHPELLTHHPSAGHDQTIINGVSRIGYMSGGKSAWWKDEEIADRITEKAVKFIEDNQAGPFFLYFSTHDIHVPRIPHPRFAGKSGMGPRGDAILEFDWSVGQVLDTLDRLGLTDNTLVIFSSDNGPVVDDGYRDQARELLGDHKPAGPLRGGKYSAFDAGTRVPFVVRWPGKAAPGESGALFSQIDIYASLAALAGVSLPDGAAPDSRDALQVLLGKSSQDREYVIEHAVNGCLSIITDGWKYIEPHAGAPFDPETEIELGNSPDPQLYNLYEDIGEKNNLAGQYPERVKELASLLESVAHDRAR